MYWLNDNKQAAGHTKIHKIDTYEKIKGFNLARQVTVPTPRLP